MILVDTSIWIDHLRVCNPALVALLQRDLVCCHDFVIGEIACGNLANRKELLELLQALPRLAPAMEDEVLYFIERHQLMGRGIGYVDMHLLAVCAMNSVRIWTKDKRLNVVADEQGWAYVADAH